ncbi:hypothetical protein [Dokdonella koreensis]|uniref:hypothetical protein n=1 Tax=Dokdonella koreensis TaxID=323415 RepID=UPI0012373F8B|nr:hypothetical protein [Dokdonella koreensis]
MDLSSLNNNVRKSRLIVVLAIVFTFSFYTIWFWIIHGGNISNSADAWGQFGDYVGGILNPLVAYFAFYWLTHSILLQKEELQDTRMALQESSKSHAAQADAAQVSVRVAAITALINLIAAEIQIKRLHIQFLSEQALSGTRPSYRSLDGDILDGNGLNKTIAGLSKEVSVRIEESFVYESELKKLIPPDNLSQ